MTSHNKKVVKISRDVYTNEVMTTWTRAIEETLRKKFNFTPKDLQLFWNKMVLEVKSIQTMKILGLFSRNNYPITDDIKKIIDWLGIHIEIKNKK